MQTKSKRMSAFDTRSKVALALIGLSIAAGFAGPAFGAAGQETGNGFLSGPHYNLNIIGKKTGFTVDPLIETDGNVMFVRLNGTTKINMTQSADGSFNVTDNDGMDGSASFNIAPGHYNVFARTLAKPGGKANVGAEGTFMDSADGSTLVPLGYVDVVRSKGRSKAANINELLYVDVTLCTSVDAITGACLEETTYNDTWIFEIPELIDYAWNYQNDGLKLLQVRFYPCTLDATGVASDYCRWQDGSAINSTKTVVAF